MSLKLLFALLVATVSAQDCVYDTEECPCFGRANVVGLVDTTGSIDSSADYNDLKSFVKGVFNKLGLGDNGIITAGVTFANHPNTVWDFSSTTSISHPEICYAVDNYFPAPKGQTQTHEAIAEAQSLLAGVDRPFAADVVFLVTDGGSENKASTQAAVDSIRAAVPGVKFCVASVRDLDESDAKKANRDAEIAYFVGDNGENINVELFANLPSKIDEAVECICSVASPPCCVPPPPPVTATPPPPPDQCKLDVVLLVDRTGSMSKANLNEVKDFGKALIDSLDLYDTRYGVISFSNKPTQLMSLGDANSAVADDAKGAVDAIDDPRGQTNTWLALDVATADFQDNGRVDAKWHCVLITDGGSDDKALTQAAADQLKAANVAITVVSVRDPDDETSTVKKDNRDLEIAGLIAGGGKNFDAPLPDLDPLSDDVFIHISKDCDSPVTGTPPPPPVVLCPADVVVLVDRTGSINKGLEFSALKTFVKDVLAGLDQFDVKTALISFSRKPNVEYGFADNLDLAAQQAAVDAIENPKGQTYTHRALEAAAAEFGNSRPGPIPKFCILITDGGSDLKADTLAAAQFLRALDVKIILVSIRLPDESAQQASNRNDEISGIIGATGVNFDAADFNPVNLVAAVVAEVCP